jgi:hypothetical protein
MRAAPPVQASSCSAGLWLSIQQALYALGTAVAAWWVGARLFGASASLAFASLGLGLVAALIARQALMAPTWQLAWDGGSWQLHAPGREERAGRVEVMLDLGSWMLVRFSPQIGARPRLGAVWLPLSRRSAAAAWPALRVALHAPQPAQPAA